MGMIQSKVSHISIYQAGISAAVLSFLFYILFGFGPKPDKPSFSPLLPGYGVLGLHNFGYTCYLNAVLQALAACSRSVSWLERRNALNRLGSQIDETVTGAFLSRSGRTTSPFVVYSNAVFPFVAVLHKAMSVINRDAQGDDAVMSKVVPGEVLEAFGLSGTRLDRQEEQDTHEMFNLITGSLTEERAEVGRRQYLNAVTALLDEVPKARKSVGGGLKRVATPEDSVRAIHLRGSERSGIVTRTCPDYYKAMEAQPHRVWTQLRSPFAGLLGIQLKCLVCMKKTEVKCEQFYSLTLTLPPIYSAPERLTINDLLKNYLKGTMVHAVDCDNCSKNVGVPTKSTFCKNTSLARLPETFCFHIHRTEWNAHGFRSKRTDFVRFFTHLNLADLDRPSDMMTEGGEKGADRNMNQKKVPNAKGQDVGAGGDAGRGMNRFRNSQYSLRAVICHRGEADSGHFITFRRGPDAGADSAGWFMVSDTMVRSVDVDTVLSSIAYMLFYEKIDLTVDDVA